MLMDNMVIKMHALQEFGWILNLKKSVYDPDQVNSVSKSDS